jgi:hypothetical protein
MTLQQPRSAAEQPILEAPRCTSTGLWLMPLDADGDKENDGHHNDNIERENASNIGGVSEKANAIFELPSTRQIILYHHASAGFPIKETFLDAIRAGNYATWPGLTVAVLHKYFPDSDETQKGHMKGQHQGIRSTKQKALDHLVESEKIVKIKVEPGTEVPLPAKRFNDIFVRVEDLAESIHSDQTGAFPYTSQCGNRYLMIAIHLDANYIFCESMKNRTEGEMIKACQKIINRMKTAGLGLKPHQLDNEVSTAYKECIHHNGMIHELVPPDNHRSNLAERSILHLNTEQSGRQIPTVTVVCSPRADRTHREPPPAIQRRTKNIGVCPRARPARLHEEAICANWVRSPSTCQAHKQTNVGYPHRSRIQPRHINGAPPMFQDLRPQNQSNKSQQHGIFQAPVLNQPSGLT